jgi:hypothetical protein
MVMSAIMHTACVEVVLVARETCSNTQYRLLLAVGLVRASHAHPHHPSQPYDLSVKTVKETR